MGNLRSSVFIARLLDSEGFSDFVANQVERYWKRSICDRRHLRKYGKLDKDITEMCKKLTEGEKTILGKFIALHKKMSFDTGLRIGLTAYAVKNDKPVDPMADRVTLGSCE